MDHTCEYCGCLNENYLKQTVKTLNQQFNQMKLFTIFVKRTEDHINTTEVSWDPFEDAQIANKVFNTMLKFTMFHDGV